MIEKIKKEIEPLLVLDDVLYCKDCGSRNIKKSYKPYKIGENIMKILDRYNNQIEQLEDKISKIEEYIEPFIINDELDHDCCEEEKHYVAMELLEIIKEEKKESDK